MHETALMQDVLKTLEASAQENGIEEVTELKLVFGSMTMIMPDAMRFAFDSFKGLYPLSSDAVLELEEHKSEATCNNCDRVYAPVSPSEFQCPYCGGIDVNINSGEELYIEYYKGREWSN